MTQYSGRSMKPSGLNKSQCHVTYSCISVETIRCWQKYLYSKGEDKRTETSWWSFSGLEGQVWRSHWAPVAPGWVKWKSLSRVWLFETPWTVVLGILQARILEWVAFPFSRGSFHPRDWTHVSNTVGGFFTSWAIRDEERWETAAPAQGGSSIASQRCRQPLTLQLFRVPWLPLTPGPAPVCSATSQLVPFVNPRPVWQLGSAPEMQQHLSSSESGSCTITLFLPNAQRQGSVVRCNSGSTEKF